MKIIFEKLNVYGVPLQEKQSNTLFYIAKAIIVCFVVVLVSYQNRCVGFASRDATQK